MAKERKPKDFLRIRKKRGICWVVIKWGFGEKDERRGTWFWVMNGIASLHFVDTTRKKLNTFSISWVC